MRVAVIGGTRFIGRAITTELVARGHDLLVIHRGKTEPEGLPDVPHLHADRSELPSLAGEIEEFRPDGLVDTIALSGAQAEIVTRTIHADIPMVVLSSMDVYRAYSALQNETGGERLPLDESSPVRDERYPYKGKIPGMDDYEKLDVEEVYLGRGGTVFRLPFVYGEHDAQRREEFILKRVRAGRDRIPFGPGEWRTSKLYAPDTGAAVANALENPEASGEIFNLAEDETLNVRSWAESILAAAGHDAELVSVPNASLPKDLQITGALSQDLVADSSKARSRLKWSTTDPADSLARSVRWHLANPPEDDSFDADSDDKALSQAPR